jgi:cyclase
MRQGGKLMRYFAILVLALSFVLPQAARGQNFDQVEIKALKVAGSVYMLQGAGGNIGVSVGDDGIIIVDDQYAPLAPKIQAALAAISDSPVRFVINTHYHGDHTGGNEFFGKSAPVIAHHNVRKRLAEGITAGGRTIPPAPEGALPVITFDQGVSIHLNGEEVRAVHFPHSHTDGDSVIWFTGSNVVHMGDTYFAGLFPFIDIDAGGSARGLLRSLDAIIPTLPGDVKVIPGHGALSDLAGLREYRAMLADSIGIVGNAIAEGKTLEQMKEEKVLAKYEALSWQFISTDRFIETLDREIRPSPRPGVAKE